VGVKVGIVGSTGYAGEFLIRILARHPEAELVCVCSAHAAGRDAAAVLPALKGLVDVTLCGEDVDHLARTCDVVFTAKKSVESMQYAPVLLDAGVKVIDIGGEFRLKDPAAYEKWYGNTHTCPELLPEAVYGLTELHRDALRSARLAANPGCYPTGAILGLAPLMEEMRGHVRAVTICASSGVSGAGRTPSKEGRNLFVSCFNNHAAYGVGTHKHTPEIEQELGFPVTFVPQLASMDRGILSVMAIHLEEGYVPPRDPGAVLAERYAGEPFIRVYERVGDVCAAGPRGTNFCDLGAVFVERTGVVCVVSALDNLLKGASGQAVQNMNVMCGFDECTGLEGFLG